MSHRACHGGSKKQRASHRLKFFNFLLKKWDGNIKILAAAVNAKIRGSTAVIKFFVEANLILCKDAAALLAFAAGSS